MNNEQYVAAGIIKELGLGEKAKVNFTKVVKNNGVELDACQINTGEDICIAPSIYFNPDNDNDDIIEEICSIYKQSIKNTNLLNDKQKEILAVFKDKEKFLSRVFPTLINSKLNEESLADRPHRAFLNMEISYRVDLDFGTARIFNNHIDGLGITEEELYTSAMNNLKEKGSCIRNMHEFLQKISDTWPFGLDLPEPEDTLPMYVVSNKDMYMGSNVMLLDNVMKDLYETFESDYYIIPSSIHEIIALPKDIFDIDLDTMVEWVRTVNTQELSPTEMLSNSIYEYSNGELKIAKEVA